MKHNGLTHQGFGLFSLPVVALLAVLMALLVTGCGRTGDLDEKERENRIVAKAQEMIDLGEYDKAITLFRKALDMYPQMARPHLDLALVLHDRQNDYMRAIYHYNRYLELRPSTEKNAMITARMQQAERAFVASRITVNGEDGPSAMELLAENSSLRKRVESLEQTVAEQEKELVGLREAERRRLRDRVITGDGPEASGAVSGAAPTPVVDSPVVETQVLDRAALEPPDAADERPDRSTGDVETVVRPPVAEEPVMTSPIPAIPLSTSSSGVSNRVDKPESFRTYTVQRGDSLSRIAFKVYGDATRWRGIQAANRDVLGDSVNVRVGQVLKIP